MKKRYPRTLSSGDNNTVIALSETEAGKLFSGDTRSDIGSEAEFNHIFLTPTGLRLIDVGISALRMQVGERLFQRFVEQELQELARFRDFFLSR